ncbi:conserved hypothetical protein [Burkholderia cenocepacia HI2424]|uniref:Uncharacterized protein n=2 Tax=Burkholderia cepacia complex TaxID=87882 RepID=A0A427P557_9BURK|nr:conserved hypothetical protein [Burkholderia cenocepacia HI2424]PNO71605.1 hypothetical protein DK10_025505 [Burkholderia cenocepacia]RSC14862.1 hypothetical protein EGT41_16930 [Burkholderia cenocepacia]
MPGNGGLGAAVFICPFFEPGRAGSRFPGAVPGCRPIARSTECRYSLRHDCISPLLPPSSRCAATRASFGAPAALTVLALRLKPRLLLSVASGGAISLRLTSV